MVPTGPPTRAKGRMFTEVYKKQRHLLDKRKFYFTVLTHSFYKVIDFRFSKTMHKMAEVIQLHC